MFSPTFEIGWIDDKAFWFILPAFDDVFIRSRSSQGFEPPGEITGTQKVVEMTSQLLMIIVMIAFGGCFLESTVHALDLALDPGMIGQAGNAALQGVQAVIQRQHSVMFAEGYTNSFLLQCQNCGAPLFQIHPGIVRKAALSPLRCRLGITHKSEI